MDKPTKFMTNPTMPKNIVLYADDDPDDLQLVEDAFGQYAKDVSLLTVSNGSEAIAALEKLDPLEPAPCLIILDVNMPVVDGKQALVRIRSMERFEKVPVVLFTTSSLPSDHDFARKYNAGFITKPLNMKQMELITDEFISHCAEEVRMKISNR